MSHLYNNQSQSPVHHTPLHTGRGGVRWVRWGGLFTNSLATAWRNLLKYKTQNIISIVCLAVGVVCFAVVFNIVVAMSINMYYSHIDTGRPVFNIFEMSEEEFRNFPTLDKNGANQFPKEKALDAALIDRLNSMELPAMREVCGVNFFEYANHEFEDGSAQPKTRMSQLLKCSPRYYHYQRYRSAITGDRIAELREGDVIITDDLRDMVYGKGTDPRGFKIISEIDGSQRIIRDVVNLAERIERPYYNAIIYCSRNFMRNSDEPRLGCMMELSEGYTAEQLREQLQNAMPECYVALRQSPFDWSDEGMFIIILLGVMLLLGSSVLLIGATGFLKMQLQLFSLRSREMALRRTMGAKPRHLFMLLMAEMAIVFAFTTLGAAVITIQFARYAVPIIQKVNAVICFDIDLIVETGMWICLATLLCSLVVAFISLYRQLHSPVGMRVGRSGHPRTRGHGFMLGVQFSVSMILAFAVLGIFYLLGMVAADEFGSHTEDKEPYRNVLMTGTVTSLGETPDLKDKLILTGNVLHISKCKYHCCTSGAEIDEGLITHRVRTMNNDNTVRGYLFSFLTTDEELIDLLDIRISSDKPTDENLLKHLCAIYVRTEEVERLREKWNLPVSSDVHTRNFYQNGSYTLIGYAQALIGYRPGPYSTPSFWIIEDEMSRGGSIDLGFGFSTWVSAKNLIFPKDGKYNKVEDAITAIYREAFPGNMNPVPVSNLYEEWFRAIRLMELMRELCLLLVIVSILCIVASVYSAIALESRGRRKEVALRKIHGAHTWDIIRLFGTYYMRLLLISAAIVSVVSMLVVVAFHHFTEQLEGKDWLMVILYLLLSILIVMAITLLTIGNKIWKVSKIHPAEVVKKE